MIVLPLQGSLSLRRPAGEPSFDPLDERVDDSRLQLTAKFPSCLDSSVQLVSRNDVPHTPILGRSGLARKFPGDRRRSPSF